jgi:transmembrane sensor
MPRQRQSKRLFQPAGYLAVNKVIKFESSASRQSSIEEAACKWLAKLNAGASDEEMKAFSAWLLENKQHIEIFFEVSAAWDHLDILLELAEVFPLEKYRVPGPAKSTPFWSVIALAASLVLVVALVFSVVGHDRFNLLDNGGLVDVTTYKTDVGQRSTVTLPDNSEIVLNTNTLIEVRYSSTERLIVLNRGEAFFAVSKDSMRPFHVVVGNHVVEAIGTEFAVQRMLDDSVEVMVMEGVVGFANKVDDDAGQTEAGVATGIRKENTITLVAGDVITTETGEIEQVEKQSVSLGEIETRLSWQKGLLLFQDEPLDQVIKEISRYTTMVIVTDDDVKGIRVDGGFRVGDVDGLLLAMKENFGLYVISLGEDYVFLTRSNEE